MSDLECRKCGTDSAAPGQAAYEAAARWDTELDEPPMLLKPWSDLNDRDRDCWHQVAVAVLAAREPHATDHATATPGQALSPDPAGFAYHVRATAFNVLTGKMAGDEWSVPRSERDAIASAIVDAVEPLIRADEREPHAAPLWPDGAPVRDADGEPKAVPELAAAMRETRELRELVDDFTNAVIDLDDGARMVAIDRIAKAARAVRKKAGLPELPS